MNSVGIYFGPKVMRIAESKGKSIVSNLLIPQSRIVSGGDFQEKVPEEMKLGILFKEEMKRAKMSAHEASLVISGKDLIIRTFDMPVIPQNELYNAVGFEVRKYIPFKIEDLIYDFQVQFEKNSKKNFILFAGIKKETVNKYMTVMKQLNMKVNAIDYSGFSLLRLLRLAGVSDKGVVAVVDVDLAEEDEINFMVLQNGFPLFSRDLTLTSEPTFETIKDEKIETGISPDKFKNELRISLDFYSRKFPGKKIDKIIFFCPDVLKADLQLFAKEREAGSQIVDLSRYLPKTTPYASSLCKAYGGALAKTIKTAIRVDLLAPKVKKTVVPVKSVIPVPAGSLFPELKLSPKALIAAVLICGVAFGVGYYQKVPVFQQLQDVIKARPAVATVSSDLTVEELTKISAEYKKKVDLFDTLLKKRFLITDTLDLLPRIITEGVWLDSLTFRKESEKAELLLRGYAYLGDSEKEWQLVNSFFTKLKENPNFGKIFINPKISLDHTQIKKTTVTNFTIAFKNYKD